MLVRARRWAWMSVNSCIRFSETYVSHAWTSTTIRDYLVTTKQPAQYLSSPDNSRFAQYVGLTFSEPWTSPWEFQKKGGAVGSRGKPTSANTPHLSLAHSCTRVLPAGEQAAGRSHIYVYISWCRVGVLHMLSRMYSCVYINSHACIPHTRTHYIFRKNKGSHFEIKMTELKKKRKKRKL